jgi:hypothetical protein
MLKRIVAGCAIFWSDSRKMPPVSFRNTAPRDVSRRLNILRVSKNREKFASGGYKFSSFVKGQMLLDLLVRWINMIDQYQEFQTVLPVTVEYDLSQSQ